MSSSHKRGTGGPGGTPLKEYGMPNTFGLAVAQKLAATGLTEAEYVQIAQRFKAKERLKQNIQYFKREGFNIVLENGRYVDKTEPFKTAISQTLNQSLSNGILPTKEDFEKAYRMLTHMGGAISVDSVLDQIENNVMKEGHSLKNNWRMITETKIEAWSRKS